MEGLLGFMLAGFALAGSPGPANLSLAATGAAFGARSSLGYLGGIIVGMVVVMGVAASGVTGVVLALPGAAPLLATLAAAYFAWLAVRIATAPPLAATTARRLQPSFFAGLFLSLVNPKGYAAMTALFSGFVLARDHLALDAALKTIILLTIIPLVTTTWLLAGTALIRLLREPRLNRTINVTFAALLLASVAFALLF